MMRNRRPEAMLGPEMTADGGRFETKGRLWQQAHINGGYGSACRRENGDST